MHAALRRCYETELCPKCGFPSREIRDQRELLRLRMTLVGIETRLKNRVHAILAKYALRFEVADVFSQKGRRLVLEHLEGLPEETRRVVRQHLELLESTERQKKVTEQRLQAIVQQRDDVELLRTLPGVGWILATVLTLEIGDIQRFNHAPELASYAGTVPRVHSSGGKTRYGRVHPDVNRYLKWALVEAGNLIVMQQQRLGDIHAVRLYRRLRTRKGPMRRR
jgi:transposase